jgi:hypothetical protein
MIMLTRIMGQHWNAVERDLLSLGYRCEDIGTPKLTLWELISIVTSSPPSSAVYHAETRDGTYTPEAQLLAGRGRQQQQPQPSMEVSQPKFNSLSTMPDYGGMKLSSFDSPEELVEAREKRAAEIRASGSKDRVGLDKYSPFMKLSG